MIEFSGRTARAGTRRFAAATAVACLTVAPLVYDATAHADGPGGAVARRDHGPAARDADHREADHRAAPRRDGHRIAGRAGTPAAAAQERGRHGEHLPAAPPRTRIIFGAKSPLGPVRPGGTYQWPYQVTNTGPEPARDVTLKARPDRHLKVVATPPQCRWTSHNNLVCRIGLIPGGQTRKGAITARIDKKAPAGRQLSNPVRLSWNGRPERDARYSGFAPVTVAPDPATATDLAVTNTVPDKTGPGGDIPYEVSVTNDGPVTAEGVIVRSAIADQPAGSPCALLAPAGGLAGNVVGKVAALKPALPPCLAAHGTPAGPAAAPQCGTVPGLNADRPITLPCAVPGAGNAAGAAVPPCLLPQRLIQVPPCALAGVGKAAGAAVPPCLLPHSANQAPPCARSQAAPAAPACTLPHPADQPPPCAVSHRDEAAVPPCAAPDKPLAHEEAGRPVCAPRVPGKSATITPQSAQIVPGVPPAHDVPAVIGRGRHQCVSQGAGFVCPIGSIPPGRTRTIRLAVHARSHAPHRLRCLSSVASGTADRNPANNSAGCHTRAGRPMTPPHQNLTAHRLPHTGFAYGLLGLCGAGLTGLGFVLYRMGRVRRGRAEQTAIR